MSKEQQTKHTSSVRINWEESKEIIADAIENDNVDFIRGVINKNTRTDLRDFQKYFILEIFKHDAIKVFNYFFEEIQGIGQNIWFADIEGQPIIKVAVSNNSFHILTSIIDKISFPNPTEQNSSTKNIMPKSVDPIYSKWLTLGNAAISCNKLEVLKFLFAKGLVIKETSNTTNDISLLTTASAKGNTEIVEYLITQGANINEVYRNMNAISYACMNKKLDLVKLLIEQGADCKIYDFAKTRTTLEINNYTKVGQLIQSLCSENEFNLVDDSFTAIFKELEGDSLTAFVETSTTNYILKKKAISKYSLKNIEHCTFLPEAIKVKMLDVISPFIKNFNERLEMFEAELLYLSNMISQPATYEDSKSSLKDFSYDTNEFKEIINVYKLFKDSRTVEFCVGHFKNIYLPKSGETLLNGLLLVNENFRNNAQELLSKVTANDEVKKILEEAFRYNKSFIINAKGIEEDIEAFKLLPRKESYPTSLEEAEKQKFVNEQIKVWGKKQAELTSLKNLAKNSEEQELPKYLALIEEVEIFITGVEKSIDDIEAMGNSSNDCFEIDGGL